MQKIKLPPQNQLPKIKASHLLLVQASQLRRKLNTALVEKCDITLSEKELLARVHQSGGQMRMSDVSDALMFTDGGATKIIKRLTERGFVTRQRSEKDGRVILIDITGSGTEKLAVALDAMASVAYPLMDETFTSEECKTLTNLLEKLDAHFN